MANSKNIEGPRTRKFWAVTATYFVVVLCGAGFAGFFRTDWTPIDPNEWGDVLSGIFSPVAFLWLVYASLSQRTELELQRNELAANNEAQLAQYRAMESQSDALRLQATLMEADATLARKAKEIWVRMYFEALLELHHQIIDYTGQYSLISVVTVEEAHLMFRIDHLPGVIMVEGGMHRIQDLPLEMQGRVIDVVKKIWATRRSCENIVRSRGQKMSALQALDTYKRIANGLATEAFNTGAAGLELLRHQAAMDQVNA